jgi:arylsulfatase A-like enzyme
LYADDLGYGDIGCYGATALPTPNLDRFAAQSLRFTQGYATAATCTPSRFSLLAGSYPWRNKDAAILAGDAPLIIPPGTPTLPSLLKEAGYATGVVGKWHLGLGRGHLNWNREIPAVPLDLGFDFSFIMAATNDRVPCVYVEGRKVVGLDPSDPLEVCYEPGRSFPGCPTGRANPELLKMKHSHGHDMSIVNGVGRIGYMRGGRSAVWRDETMGEVFLEKALSFITLNRKGPFFLYYALHQPHVPRIPSPRFAGATPLGPRGDVIAEMDWCVGEFLRALEELGQTQNTLVVFSSDNGPVLDDGYQDHAAEWNGSHRPAGALRGGKYSLFDGGTRVPFLIRWPEVIRPGESSALVSHLDFLASFAALAGIPLPSQAGPDSLDLRPAFFGQSLTGRQELVTEGLQGRTLLRQGDWVYLPSYQGPPLFSEVNIESGYASSPQLYRITEDLSQRVNLAGAEPERAKAMAGRLSDAMVRDRTRP